MAHTRRRVAIAACSLGVSALLLLVAAQEFSRHFSPLLRQRVVAQLAGQLHRPVELDALDISVVHRLEVRGAGLRILDAPPAAGASAARPAAQHGPLLSVASFAFRLSLQDMMQLRAASPLLRVQSVHLQGVQVNVPPTPVHGSIATSSASPALAWSISRLRCDDMHLVFASNDGTAPLRFDLHGLDLKEVGPAGSFPFAVTVIYPLAAKAAPVSVTLTGHIGAVGAGGIAATSFAADYSLADADLSAITGVQGLVRSSGHIAGTPALVAVDGIAHSAALSLPVSARALPLDARFHLTVDGTTGNTVFAPLQATLPHGSLEARGTMKLLPGSGADIAMELAVPRGRIEELLEIGTRTLPPLMTGNLTLHTRLHLPAGPSPVQQKLQATGSLAIDGVQFTDPRLQQRINGLSQLAQGKINPLHLTGDGRAPVQSRAVAEFSLGGGILTVPSLRYQVPGATVQLAGTYALGRDSFAFQGHAAPDALGHMAQPAGAAAAQPPTAQPATGGLAGFGSGLRGRLRGKLAPVLNKIAGVTVPVTIIGQHGEVTVSLAHNRVDESTRDMAAHEKAKRQSVSGQRTAYPPAGAAQRRPLAGPR